MSRVNRCLLIARSSGWYLVDEKTETLLADRDTAAGVLSKKMVQRIDPASNTVLGVLLDSSSVLHAAFNSAEVGGSKKHSTLLYRLESDLPLSAEDTIADFRFESQRRDSRVVALAVEKPFIDELLSGLRSAKLKVKTIASRTAFAAQSLIEKNRIPDSCALIIVNSESSELLLIEDKAIVAWRLLDNPNASVRDTRMLIADSKAQSVCLVGALNQLEEWPALGEVNVLRFDTDVDNLEIEQGRAVLSGKSTPWFDFSRDPNLKSVGERSNSEVFSRLALVASICFLTVTVACLWRTVRVKSMTTQVQEQQADLFRKTFPNQRLPTAVLKRFQSEHAKVMGSRTLDSNSIPTPQRAIPILQDVLQGLPSDLDLSVVEIRVEDGDLYLDLEILEHGDAGMVATALQQRGIELSPPTTETSGERVRALIRGIRRSEIR